MKCLNAVMGHISASESVTMKVVSAFQNQCPVIKGCCFRGMPFFYGQPYSMKRTSLLLRMQ